MYNNYRDHLFASPIYLYENTIKYEISNHLFVPMYLYENVTSEGPLQYMEKRLKVLKI